LPGNRQPASIFQDNKSWFALMIVCGSLLRNLNCWRAAFETVALCQIDDYHGSAIRDRLGV
jgi:hypothetical protein